MNFMITWIISFSEKSFTCLQPILLPWVERVFGLGCEEVRILRQISKPKGRGCYAKSLQSCPTLCDPIDGSPPGFPVPGILQARTLEWVAVSFSNAWKWKKKWESEVAQLCPTFSDPMGCSLPGSSIHGIFQAGVLEWGAIAFSGRKGKVAANCQAPCRP